MESCRPTDEGELPTFSLGMEFLTPQKERKEKENKEQARPVLSRFANHRVENVIKQLVHTSAVRSSRYEALGSLKSTQEAKAALGHASSNPYAFFVLSKLPACFISIFFLCILFCCIVISGHLHLYNNNVAFLRNLKGSK